VGYRGVAISAAAGGILLGAVRLRRFPAEAPLVVFSSWAALSLAGGCAILAAFVPLSWSGYAVLGAALFAVGAAVIPLDRYRAARTLGGIACVCIGVSLIGAGSSLLRLDPIGLILFMLINLTVPILEGAAAIIGMGVSLIVGGVALLLQRSTMLSIAGVGFGVSLIGAGLASLPLIGSGLGSLSHIAALSAWLIAAGVAATIGAGLAFPLVRSTLLGVAGVGLGISLISVGAALLLIPVVLRSVEGVGFGASLISAGAAAIVAGVAFLLARRTLIGVAGIGFGASLISAAVPLQFLGYTILAAGLIVGGVIAIVAGAIFLLTGGRLLGVADVGVAISLIGAAVAAHLIQDTMLPFEAMFSNATVIAVLGTGVAVGAWAAIGAGITAIGARVTLPLARDTLTGIAGICLGVSLVGAGVAAQPIGPGLVAVWLIVAGVLLIPLAVARMRNKYVLGGVAAIGFGASLTVLALYYLLGGDSLFGTATIGAGLAAMVAGIAACLSQAELRRWLLNRWAAWTRAPNRPPRP